MGHIYPKAAQVKVQEQRKVLRPFLVVVAPDRLDRGDLPKLLQDLPAADIPGVEDHVAALQVLNHLRSQQVMGIRYDSDLHGNSSPAAKARTIFIVFRMVFRSVSMSPVSRE